MTLNIMTLCIMDVNVTLSIIDLIVALSRNDTKHHDTRYKHSFMLYVIMLNVLASLSDMLGGHTQVE
jgi:hypothetical protein